MIGTAIDAKYLVRRQLGAGAMGAVFEAEHTSTGRRVAVKVISAGEMSSDPGMLARFQREARAAGGIDTQHITQVLDAGYDAVSRMPYIVMELMSGEDVQGLLKRVGPLSPDLALRIAAQACFGLQKAHEAHVVHRDIKPANLFLARREAGEVIVKILDFGIAKVKMEAAQEVETAHLTKTGSMLGSPLFMSPEQAQGLKDVDHRSDLWSLGVMLYQALCGRTPHQHIPTFGQLIIAICQQWPTPIQQFAPWVAPEIAAIVHKALRHRPDERFQSAAEMFQAMRPLLRGGWAIHEDMFVPIDPSLQRVVAPRFELTGSAVAVQTGPALPASPHAASTAGVAVTQGGQAPQKARGSRSRAPVLAAAGMVLLAGLGGGVFMMRSRAVGPAAVAAPPAEVAAVVAPASEPPAPAPSAAAEATKLRWSVTIKPQSAVVLVDGETVTLDKGVLTLEGKPGQTFKVKVSSGPGAPRREKDAKVILGEDGAEPSRIDLWGTAGAAPKPPKPPPPGKKGPEREFE